MIFIEKNGRFGNFLFQYFIARYIQRHNHKKIIIFSKKENIYNFNSSNNIDSIVKGYFALPKYSRFLNCWKKKCIYINDENYKHILDNNNFSKNYFFYINGFFQNIDLINKNSHILKDILDKNKLKTLNNFSYADLTIHIRHLHDELGTLDTNLLYQEQPKMNLYEKVINELNPKKIKIICSSKNNRIYKELKLMYKEKIFLESNDDIFDFINIVNSKNIILSNSTYALWGSLLSNAKNVYIPNIGILKKIFKYKKLNLESNFLYR
jgi:hypothetical protein